MPAGHRMHQAYVGLGSNLEQPVRQVLAAFDQLDALPYTRLAARSSLYRSGPMGKLDQPDFVNAVARLDTGLSPAELMHALLLVEAQHGRRRGEPNAPRTLDLDLLLYDDEVIGEPALTVPHPRMHERAFVLVPLAEINPGAIIPGRGQVASMLEGVADQRIHKVDADQEAALHRR
jgi:2-amino-4-hydroxy-6-hydroxymethyldihydropteridine diphosphokinase